MDTKNKEFKPPLGKEFGFIYPFFYRLAILDYWWVPAILLSNNRLAIDIYITLFLFFEICFITMVYFNLKLSSLLILISLALLANRLADMIMTVLSMMVRGTYRQDQKWASRGRTFILNILNIIQVFLSFALFYYFIPQGGIADTTNKIVKLTITDSLYFSFITGITLGYGDFYPVNGLAKTLAIIEPFIIVMILLNMIYFGRGAYQGETLEDEYRGSIVSGGFPNETW